MQRRSGTKRRKPLLLLCIHGWVVGAFFSASVLRREMSSALLRPQRAARSRPAGRQLAADAIECDTVGQRPESNEGASDRRSITAATPMGELEHPTALGVRFFLPFDCSAS